MKRLFNVAFRALIFGIIIYFFLGEMLPKIQQSKIIKKSKEKFEELSIETGIESEFELDDEKDIAYKFSKKKYYANTKVRVQSITEYGKTWDTLSLNESKIGEDKFMYWIETNENKPLNIEIIEK